MEQKIAKLIEGKKWHKMGRWKEPTCIETAVNSGIVEISKIPSVFDLFPSAYISVDHAQYIEENEFQTQVGEVKKMLELRPEETSARFKKIIQTNSRKLLRFSPRQLTADSLYRLFRMVQAQGRQWYEIMLADIALQELYKKSLPARFNLGGTEYSAEILLAKVALPKKLFPIIAERSAILRIASLVKEGKDAKKAVKAHARKYGWMNSLCWWDPPHTEAFYTEEAEKLAKKDPEEQLLEFSKGRREQRRVMLETLKAVAAKFPKAALYIDIIRDLTDLKEENWDVVSITGTCLRPKFEALAKKYRLSYNQFLMLGKDEMCSLTKGTFSADKDELNGRLAAPLVIAAGNEQIIRSGGIVKEIQKIFDGEVENVSSLKGMPVWPGKVTGKVRVMFSMDDVPSIEEGEVLVCPMTDPDYMPAIHKASAIVTDQGGVLCHAAIVAREFQKPCVVGTKIATRVFKTGDRVEVDAERGIITVLKRNS